jgi:RadC-like JAB domain-containing protein
VAAEEITANYLLRGPGLIPSIGPEKGSVVPDEEGITKYTSVEGSYRYVAHAHGHPVSALQVVSRDGKSATIALVYTVVDHQRRGFATKLLARARRDFDTIEHAPEAYLSTDGRAWRDAVGESGKLSAMPESERATTPQQSGTHPVIETSYLGDVRRVLIDLGSPDPDGDLNKTGLFWEKCRDAGVAPQIAAATIYSTARHKHEVARTVLKEAAEAVAAGAAEAVAASPTREEWEVIVRRTGSMNAITNAAGRKADAVYDRNVIFGDFYDDEQATAFARKMTHAGFIAMTGPRKMPESLGVDMIEKQSAAEGASERVYRWTEVWWHYPTEAEKFAKFLDRGNTIAMAFNRIVRTNASGPTIRKVIAKHKWEGEHTLRANVDKQDLLNEGAGDPSAMGAAEPVAVIHEEPGPCKIPWIKVERDPKKHAEYALLGDKYGPVKNAVKVYEICGAELLKEDVEVFLLLPLNVRGELKSPPYEIARGQRSRVHVEAIDILRAATDAGAEGYVVVHCHPTGKVEPSKADIQLTDNIKKATAPYGKSLCFIDHVIVGRGCAYSIFEKKRYKC